MNPKTIVADGYDAVSTVYQSDTDPAAEAKYGTWLEPIFKETAPGAPVLDLGCGCGVPSSRLLAERFAVTGVDISPVQIRRARSLVPRARFMVDDMAAVSFAPSSFAAIVSLYAIIHLPLQEQPRLIGSLHRWLRDSGLALLIVGSAAWTGTEQNWLGVDGAAMYWSHADAATYRAWFQKAGFDILEDVFIPEGEGGHQKFLLRKGSGG